MKLLSLQQMKNLTDERLNEYRKTFPKKLGHLQHLVDTGNASHDDLVRLNSLKEHYSVIKEVMAKRKHIEPKQKKNHR